MELLLKGFIHFREIYEELEQSTPDVVLIRPVQETLLALRECAPRAFTDSGITPGTKSMPAIETPQMWIAFRNLRDRGYGYAQRTSKPDPRNPKKHIKQSKSILVEPFMIDAFSKIYGLACSIENIEQRLFRGSSNLNGLNFMRALTRMLHAFSRYAASTKSLRAPV